MLLKSRCDLSAAHRIPQKFGKPAALCLRAILFLGITREVIFLLQHGLDTCNWLLSTGSLVPAKSTIMSNIQEQLDSAAPQKGQQQFSWVSRVGHQWQASKCSSKVYSPNEAKNCFQKLGRGRKFDIGFIGDHWIKDLFNLLSEYVMDASAKVVVEPPFSARLQTNELDVVLRWLPYMNNPRPFGATSKLKLDDWKPQVVIAGAALWTILDSKSDASKFREYYDNLRMFAENAAQHPERETVWKLTPLYMRDARYVDQPVDMDYESTNEALQYYNDASQCAFKESVPQEVRVWAADADLLRSMRDNDLLVYADWKHFANETLFHELQILLNFVCNKVDGDQGSCCSPWSLTFYFLRNPIWLIFYLYCLCRFTNVDLYSFSHSVLKGSSNVDEVKKKMAT